MVRASFARLAAVVSIALVGVVFAAVASAALPTPHDDPFYKMPKHAGAGPAGDVIRSRSITTLSPTPSDTWQIMYRSQSATGKPVAVTGTVFVPTQPWSGPGRRPLITLAPGTQGLADTCAASYQFASGAEYEAVAVNSALAMGWGVVVTDYQGLGPRGPHPYSLGKSEGPNVLDAARAAERLDGAGLSGKAPVGILGYSQGGGAAVWAAEMQPSYAEELKLKGVAAGGVPANLSIVGRFLDGGPSAGLLLAASSGLSAAYPGTQSKILNGKGKALRKTIRQECVGDLIANHVGAKIADYSKVKHPLANPRVKKRLKQNQAGQHAPQVPILVYHAGEDDIVPIGQAHTLFNTYCAKGATAKWTVLPGLNHAAGIFAGGPGAISYLDDRFNGMAAPNDC